MAHITGSPKKIPVFQRNRRCQCRLTERGSSAINGLIQGPFSGWMFPKAGTVSLPWVISRVTPGRQGYRAGGTLVSWQGMSSFSGQNNGQVSNGTTPLCRLAGGKLNDV